jgi:hypothetical protein
MDLLPLLRATMRMMGKRDYDVNAYAPLEQWTVGDFTNFYGQDKARFAASNPILAKIINDNFYSIRTMMSTTLTKNNTKCLIFFAPVLPNNPKGNLSNDILTEFIELMDLFNIYPQYK